MMGLTNGPIFHGPYGPPFCSATLANAGAVSAIFPASMAAAAAAAVAGDSSRPPETQPAPIPGVVLGPAVEGTGPEALPRPDVAAKPPPPPVEMPDDGNSRKRMKLDTSEFQSSAAFKIRSVFKGLRPHFVDVFRAPDFRNCDAASEIRKQMLVLMELSKQLKAEAVNMGRKKRPLAENQDWPCGQSVEYSENRSATIPSEKSTSLEGQTGRDALGTYVVGGSPIGWNFILYPGRDPKYCGESKDIFRSRQAAKE